MKKDFQVYLKRFLFQDQSSLNYLDFITDDIFDQPQDKILFDAYKAYCIEYKNLPDKVNFFTYLSDDLRADNVGEELTNYVMSAANDAYDRLPKDTGFIHKKLKKYALRKGVKSLLIHNTTLTKNLEIADVDKIVGDLRKIKSKFEAREVRGRLFRKDYKPDHQRRIKAHETPFSKVNACTNLGGFYRPQLIVFLKAPKVGGTILLLNLAYHHMINGLNVYFADFENGLQSLESRFAQLISGATQLEVESGRANDRVKKALNLMRKVGAGDIYFGEFRGKKDHLGHVETDIDRLIIEDGFKPDCIIYDYIDLPTAEEKQQDTRHQIQYNYHHAISINKKYDSFCYTVSKVTASAFEKTHFSGEDFAEDKEKAYNCHSSWSFARPEGAILGGYASLSPLFQREGLSLRPDKACIVRIDEATQKIWQMPEDELDALLLDSQDLEQPDYQGNDYKKSKKFGKKDKR